MVRIVQSRTRLDQLLADEDLVLLLLSGATGTDAAACHDLWEGGERKEWRVAVLITDLSVLTAAERTQWFGSDERYAVRDGVSGRVARKGSTADLLRQDGAPSIQKLMAAFRAGEEEE